MKTKQRLFLDVHAIQAVPPSNINRDDTGSPKTAQYGGVTRARVSSQSWKRVMRQYFKEHGEIDNVGVRTKKVVHYVAEKITNIDESIEQEKAMKLAEKVVNGAGVKTPKNSETEALFFISSKQADKLAQAALEGKKANKELRKILASEPSIDIALFGRMLASDAGLNVDASSQVAHAISTNGIQTEFDYFTAMDDYAENPGAAMIESIEYNSSTLYRYANVAIHEFCQQIGGKNSTINALKLYIEAFAKSMPAGKINTFANQTLPQALLVCLRGDRPVSLVSAFERPIYSTNGHVEKSIKQLIDEYEVVKQWVDAPLHAFSLGMNGFEGNQKNLKHLLEQLEESLNTLLDY